MNRYFLMVDGASKGNPGEASYGAVCFEAESLSDIPSLSEFKENKKALFYKSESIGLATNNEAEYAALVEGLRECEKNNLKNITVFMDSELVVFQMQGKYKVKNPRLKEFYLKALALTEKLHVSFVHIRREKNAIADYLANLAYQLK
ncbi:MAG: ribonuclease HI family protein [Spirochaetia bacterium]|nr:ribonuclease HI family protein [Spirochaetia bacterium]